MQQRGEIHSARPTNTQQKQLSSHYGRRQRAPKGDSRRPQRYEEIHPPEAQQPHPRRRAAPDDAHLLPLQPRQVQLLAQIPPPQGTGTGHLRRERRHSDLQPTVGPAQIQRLLHLYRHLRHRPQPQTRHQRHLSYHPFTTLPHRRHIVPRRDTRCRQAPQAMERPVAAQRGRLLRPGPDGRRAQTHHRAAAQRRLLPRSTSGTRVSSTPTSKPSHGRCKNTISTTSISTPTARRHSNSAPHPLTTP